MNLGPVSSVLEADLASWARRHGVVIWVDAEGHYSHFVEQLMQQRAEERGYEMRAFGGDHLELVRWLEQRTRGSQRPRLVVHFPGVVDDTHRTAALYELYPGVRYQKQLPTLVREAVGGKVSPDTVAAFTSNREMTLEMADAWLRETVATNSKRTGTSLRYSINARALEPEAGMNRLEAKVVLARDRTVPGIGRSLEVELVLCAPDAPDVSVELGHTSDGARLAGDRIYAQVGSRFEVLFRLLGPVAKPAGVVLRHAGPTGRVLEARLNPVFSVERNPPPDVPWLERLPDGDRQVFEHIDTHGSITEPEATRMLGSARRFRQLSRRFEEYVALAPFDAVVEMAPSGVKRFSKRKGSGA